MPDVSLHLLAGFRMTRESGEIAPLGKKAQALLAYLALNPNRRHTREKLATLLWGDRFDEQARHSLRQTLLDLRKTLEGGEAPILVTDGDEIALSPDAIEVDAITFQRLATDDNIAGWERASALYSDNLLEGLNIPAEEFNVWLDGEKARLRELACDVLRRLAEDYCQTNRHEPAVEAARRLLALDPLREPAHRLLMALHEASGDRSAALKQYQICADVLRREFDADPEPETMRLYEEIRTQQRKPKRQKKSAVTPSVSQTAIRARRVRWRWVTTTILTVLFVVAATTVTSIYIWEKTPIIDEIKKGFVKPSLPSKPSIVVLPFVNLSGDPVQDQFADGITEDITTALSIISEMFVIARTTTLFYKGKPVNIDQVAEELGVRYVLVGSVQQFGDQVRVTAQLIDALGGNHVWAGQYDRNIRDIFAVQDEITLQIVTALRVQMTEGEQERVALVHGTKNLQAWLLGIQGTLRARQLTREDNAVARSFFQRAAELDPKYPGAWDGQAWTHLLDAWFSWSESGEASIHRAAALAQKALELDLGRSRTYGLLGTIQLLSGNHAQAVVLGENAVALDPNGAEVAAFLAATLTYTGELDRSVALTSRAMRLSPYYPDWYRWNLGRAYRLMGQYEDATAALEIRLAENPGALLPRIELVATYSSMGRQAEARAMAAEVLSIDPSFSVGQWMQVPPYNDAAMTKRDADALRMAGLPG